MVLGCGFRDAANVLYEAAGLEPSHDRTGLRHVLNSPSRERRSEPSGGKNTPEGRQTPTTRRATPRGRVRGQGAPPTATRAASGGNEGTRTRSGASGRQHRTPSARKTFDDEEDGWAEYYDMRYFQDEPDNNDRSRHTDGVSGFSRVAPGPELYEQLVLALENVDRQHSEKLAKQDQRSRTRGEDSARLLELWLKQRGWNRALAERLDIHPAKRKFRGHEQALHVVRHPIYGLGGRLLGWQDRAQAKDRRQDPSLAKWMSNTGPSPVVAGAHYLNGHSNVVLAEGMSDWGTCHAAVSDPHDHQMFAPLSLMGAARAKKASEGLLPLLSNRTLFVLGDNDRAGSNMARHLMTTADPGRTRILWCVSSVGDLSDWLSVRVRTMSVARAHGELRRMFQRMLHSSESARHGEVVHLPAPR